MARRLGARLLAFALLPVLAACAPAVSEHEAAASAPSLAAESGEGRTVRSPVDAAYDRLSPRQRVGQLLMIGVTSTGATEEMVDALAAHEVGNVFLRGPSDLGVPATAAITRRLERVAASLGVRPFVSADQEGGNAQQLTGEGFSTMPTGLTQGTQRSAELRADARSWARELRSAGVTLDLAPVADVVPVEVGTANEPIGSFRREYGATPAGASHGVEAFVLGMDRARVATTLKHFPGLGRATGNTDSDPTATDPTARRDRMLRPFAAGVRAGSPFVMVSSATYPRIPPGGRACFSSVVMRDMLRGDLGFEGVIVSDSFGSASVAPVPPGRRAVRFLAAGGTMVLDTSYLDAGPMSTAILVRAARDPAFAATVAAAVRRVLAAKQVYGLLD